MLRIEKKLQTSIFLVILSGVILGLSMLFIIHWLAWIMLIPLFYAAILHPGRVFFKGFLTGFIAGLILFSWMIASSRLYTGTAPYIGFPLWFLCSVYFGLVTGIALKLFMLLKIKQPLRHAWWLNALVAGSVWIIVDWIRMHILPGVPWLNYILTFTQTKWNLPLQLISYTGIWGLTFIIVTVNVMFADILINKIFKAVWLPVSIIACLMLIGVVSLNKPQLKNKKQVKVAMICENTGAKTRWLPETGDSLATIFFDLNKRAVLLNPQIILWSESAIPWNLAMDDELITKCLEITWPTHAGHIIGIFTPSETDRTKKHNSAYYIEPDGAITARYDKVQLLAFLEQPFAGAKIPFLSNSAIIDIIPGKKHNLLKTAYGYAGLLICNEILSQQPYRKTIRQKPHLLTVISNNAWFEGSRLPLHHFYSIRLRAVESGKDIVINCNRGVSGIIHSNGEIQVSEISTNPMVFSGMVNFTKSQSFYARNGDWFILMAVLFTITIFIFNLFTIKSK